MFIQSPISGPSPPTTKVSEELPNSDLFQVKDQPQVLAPSEIFENQRILGVILEHFEHDKSLEAARKNLRLAALTSKGFLEPAMNSLWSSLGSLMPLLFLLPFASINNVYVSRKINLLIISVNNVSGFYRRNHRGTLGTIRLLRSPRQNFHCISTSAWSS
jgi:hypothetical protein